MRAAATGALCLAAALAQAGPTQKTVEIAPGVHMPLAVLGTAEYKGKAAQQQVKDALALGFVAIDTAHGYGGLDFSYDQKDVGKGLKGVNRSSFFIITKVPGGKSKEETTKDLEEDLTQLQLDYVDHVMIHHPVSTDDTNATIKDQWAALEEFHKAGKARSIGVSNFNPGLLSALLETATVPPSLNQVLYHAGMGDDPDGIVSFCAKHGITVQAFSAMDEGNQDIISGEPLASIGKAHNVTAPQVALRWLVQHDPPLSYVTAAKNKDYLLEDISVFDFELTADEYKQVSDMRTCKSGGMKLPFCLDHPYWPGSASNPCCCKTSPAGLCCCK